LLDRLADEHMRLKAQTPPDQPETGPGGISPEI
jgi:hypothetical protein